MSTRSHSSVWVSRLSVLCLASFGDRQHPLFPVRNKADIFVQLEHYLGPLGYFCTIPSHAAGGARRRVHRQGLRGQRCSGCRW